MLEESIRKYEKIHPAEIALAMLSFLQSELPAGGTAAETRFLNVFVPLCECIFGPMVMSSPDNRYRHKDGGWLSSQNPWTRTTTNSNRGSGGSLPSSINSPTNPLGHPSAYKLHLSTSETTINSQSFDSDPVVKLLGTAGKSSNNREPLPMTLIEAISKESHNRPSVTFPLPFHSLPRPLQDAWLALIKQQQATMMSMLGNNRNVMPTSADDLLLYCSRNDLRLFGQLLRKGPDEQTQLKLYTSRSKQLHSKYAHAEYLNAPVNQQSMLLPQRSSTISTRTVVSFPSSSAHYASISCGITSSKVAGKETFSNSLPESTDILLSMLEYYLFLFLRFPLGVPEQSSSGASALSIPGVSVHRVQSTTSNNALSNNISVVRETFGESLYYHIFRRYIRYFLPYDTKDNHQSIAFYRNEEFHESELFLRLVIAMWLEGQPRLSPTENVLQSMLERRRLRTGLINNVNTSTTLMMDLNSSYDLTQTLKKYEPLPSQVHKCLRMLIIHAVLDPELHGDNLDNSTRRLYSKNRKKLCLSPSVTILQQPVYNYIRSTFRFAPIHSSSESSFYGALNIWLIWLEPWNATQCKYAEF